MKISRKNFPFLAGSMALILAALACAPFSSSTPSTNTQVPPPPRPVNTVPSLPTLELPTPTEEYPPAFFTEEFSYYLENWSFYVHQGDSSSYSEKYEDDMLVMQLDEEDLYVYYIYEPWLYEDVLVEVTTTNMGRNSNNINIICRSSDYGWYEFTVQNDGLYSIWAYDKAGGTDYNLLWNGASAAIEQGKGTNTIGVACIGTSEGTQLSIYVNYQELKTFTEKSYYFPEGQVGFGLNVSPSNPVLPVIVGFQYLTISEP